MSNIVFTAARNMGYLPRTGAFVRLNGALSAAAGSAPTAPSKVEGAPSTTPVEKGVSGEIALWGDANDFPQQVIKAINANTILPAVLEWKVRAVYGGGVVYGRVTGYDKDGNEQFKRERIPEVEAFFRRSNIPRYAFESLQNIIVFNNGFPEIITSRDRSLITSLSTPDTAFYRYSVPTLKSPVPQWGYISANWPEAKPGDGYTTQVPVLDPYLDAVERLREDTRGYKFIYPLSIPSPGQALYQLAAWNSIRKSGWLDVAQAIPEFKAALFKNQLTIKYLIEADIRYWQWKYPDWDSKLEEQREAIIDEELTAFEDKMAGTQGTGKAILTVTIPDPQNGQPISVFKVTPIDDKIKSGLHIEDSQEASSHIYTALSVDPTLVGISPGKGMGAGSGSDKRVAFNTFISTHRFHQDLVLEPLYLVRDYNGWPADLEFRFLNPLVQTLDASSPVKTSVGNAAPDNAGTE
ncbi:hypothetical protein [Hymenobacter crusticola]|uniref:Uncharacterized protein n=1 Tax=Hymenobacter crusticola TaxID=1770526 RepID=A0A243W5M1_9BACT|nr:hypothetical protein [Hymenobacter crusticola]OUJ68665.1 hypothetical protein BXP70_27645 [Hymenobacter crusticola]